MPGGPCTGLLQRCAASSQVSHAVICPPPSKPCFMFPKFTGKTGIPLFDAPGYPGRAGVDEKVNPGKTVLKGSEYLFHPVFAMTR